MQEQLAALLLVETHQRPGWPLPRLHGFSRQFAAARPDGHGGVAILLADWWPVQAALWRSSPADGRLWLRVTGLLPDSRPLMLGVGYLPPRDSGGCPADIDGYFLRWQLEVAEAEAEGPALLGIDGNARVGSEEDWPEDEPGWERRRSADAQVNSHGRQLLSLCRASTLRICNGRVAGATSGAATSFGSRGSGRSVIDLWLASASLLPVLPWLAVARNSWAAEQSDHATVLLGLAAPLQPRRGSGEQPAAGSPQQRQASQPERRQPQPQPRQFRQATEAQLAEAAVAVGAASAQLEALAARAEAATTVGELAAIAEDCAQLVVAALELAGVPERGGNSSSGIHSGQEPGLPRHIRERYGIREARRARRQAEQAEQQAQRAAERGQGSQAALREQQHVLGRCRNLLKRKLAAAWRGVEQLRGAQLELLAKQDPHAFFFRYRSRGSRVVCGVDEEELVRHFEALLGGAPAQQPPAQQQPPARPPPEPPPGGSTAAAAAAEPASQQQPSAGERQPGSGGHPAGADALAARLHSPFTAAEVAAFASKVKPRKSVAGSLPPWFLKVAAEQLAPVLAAQFNAWWRLGQLPPSEAISHIAAVLKPGANPTSCSSYRGIAVGTLAAKLYAAILERRLSDWAEASGSRAAGQFGFRRKRSTAQAALVLRSLQDQHRRSGQQLWVAWVDFKQAYDRVPRQQLWEKLAARGLGGEWLRAVQALYADVPMAVRTAAGLSPCFQASVGLKQGCPASPTLFGLYIDDFEEAVAAARQRGVQLDLPSFSGSDSPVPPLLYADDMALLATSAAGLQRQLDLLQQYCSQWGLTVNTVKTKVMLLCGARTERLALEAAEAAGLSFGGAQLEAVASYKYLGIVFHSSTCLAGVAGTARAQLARAAMHSCRARCAELGIEAADVQLRLFSTMVDSVLSYGAEVWGVQLAAKAAARGGSAGSAAERLHLGFLRQLLGVRQSTPNAVVLAETGEQPLWQRWLRRAAKLWNRVLQQPEGSLLRQALAASCSLADGSQTAARQSWAEQLAAGMAAVGLPLDLAQPAPIGLKQLAANAREHQAAQLLAAAAQAGASRLQHYVFSVCGGAVTAESVAQRQPYLEQVRERRRREAVAQLRTGSHWGPEETMRWQGVPREQRICPRCDMGAIGDVPHMVFHCPFSADIRDRFAELFSCVPDPSVPHALATFLSREQPAPRLTDFARTLSQHWAAASEQPPPVP